MKTDELVALLATGTDAVEPGATARRFATALGWGMFGAMLAMAITLGVRSDIAAASKLPMFWMKLAFPLFIAIAALYAAMRLSRPGMRLGRIAGAIAAPVAAIWLASAFVLLGAAPGERDYLIFGESWDSCPFNIALLSVPVFGAAIWAMKGLAPTRLTLAGGAAGLLAGSIGAAIYSLHCPEMEVPFLGIWYVLGMLIPTVAGAVIGPRLLRW